MTATRDRSDQLSITSAPKLSVIVTVSERPAPLAEIYHEYSKPLRDAGYSYEFLFTVEPWGLGLTREISELADSGHPVRVLHGGQTLGEAGLLRLAGSEALGEIVVTLPSYHRVEAGTLPVLIEAVSNGIDLAVARRYPRHDSWINRVQNRVFHAALRSVSSGQQFQDVACGVRAMRREVLLDLPLYGDFFRFLPLVAVREGYQVMEIKAQQHPRDEQPRVYRPGVYLRRAVDLLGLFFLLRFTDKPLRFFGLLGSGMCVVGSGILLWLFIERLGGRGIADRPLLLLGLLVVVVGIQAVALGLVGEIIVHLHASSRPSYRVGRPTSPDSRDEVTSRRTAM